LRLLIGFNCCVDYTIDHVRAFRFQRHHLTQPANGISIAELVHSICGCQAQVLSAAELQIRARMPQVTRERIRTALAVDRSIVKTWCMRGTVHLLPAKQLGIYLAGRREAGLQRNAGWLKKMGYEKTWFDDVVAQIRSALANGPMTRREIAGLVSPNLRDLIVHSWGAGIQLATAAGAVVFAPGETKDVRFVRMDHWLPGYSDPPEEEAQNELLRGYLQTYGPASLGDFAIWLGGTVGLGRKMLNRIADEVIEIEVGSQRLLLLKKDLKTLVTVAPPTGVKLLPNFDPVLLGHKDRSHLVPRKHHAQVFRVAGWISPTILLDGRVIGTWGWKKKGKGIEIGLEPFGRLPREAKVGIEKEVADIGRFFDQPAIKRDRTR
jgi:hypothetical protein